MSRYRRWNELLELLAADGQLQVERAAQVLGVSAATIRRDFDELARQQMLTRIRGGAVAKGVTYDLPLRYKTERHPTEKQRIAAVAAGLVLPGQIVGLNGGTTTTEVARALAVRPDLNSGAPSPAVTIVTNALNIATELAVRQHIKIVATGGVARPQSYELTGPLATGVRGRGEHQPADGRAGGPGRGDRGQLQGGPARVRPDLHGRRGGRPGHRHRHRARRRRQARRRRGQGCHRVSRWTCWSSATAIPT